MKCKKQMKAIKASLEDYHYALDTRQHGGVAAGDFIHAVERILDMHWKQNKIKNRRHSNELQ